MKYGLIGCGRISRKHIKAALDNSLQIVALCDLDLNNIRLVREEYKLYGIREYSNYEKMINELDDLDLVSICTPHESHAEIAKKLIRANINVIIEKPVTLNSEDGEELISLSKEYNVKVTVCHQNRFNPPIVYLHERINSSNFGKLLYLSAQLRWNRNEEYYRSSEWRGSENSLDGILMNQAIHILDIILWIVNSKVLNIDFKLRKLRHKYNEMEDFAALIIEFENDVIVSLEATSAIYLKNLESKIGFFYENASIQIGGTALNKIDYWISENLIEQTSLLPLEYPLSAADIYGEGHYYLFKDMINSIIFDHEPAITIRDGLNAVELILRIYNE
jgi:UDP-N-acetyl-2-amino-2-deoxyglucuronate dehydrogenase